ncbi:hypothetical protein CSIM01_04857 [Colletotrichum simmondsii]|uniref:Uncharacterized protein n=1 Tax=Colletotrichum simmondsii TaxID=703756 RepID=A0A135TK41_9PEZI|nr:hypothetical protein CSIM01_04857 [Colletotrichum simmondsii]
MHGKPIGCTWLTMENYTQEKEGEMRVQGRLSIKLVYPTLPPSRRATDADLGKDRIWQAILAATPVTRCIRLGGGMEAIWLLVVLRYVPGPRAGQRERAKPSPSLSVHTPLYSYGGRLSGRAEDEVPGTGTNPYSAEERASRRSRNEVDLDETPSPATVTWGRREPQQWDVTLLSTVAPRHMLSAASPSLCLPGTLEIVEVEEAHREENPADTRNVMASFRMKKSCRTRLCAGEMRRGSKGIWLAGSALRFVSITDT